MSFVRLSEVIKNVMREGIRSVTIRRTVLLSVLVCAASALAARNDNPFLARTFEENGRLIDEIIVPGSPPPAIRPQAVTVPEPNKALGINTIANVPAFSWCYGCSATSAAMLMGYYDNTGCPNMYSGPANGGVCPMSNDPYWGNGESPLSATHIGKDGRVARGHVEDYWIAYNNTGPDPYIVNGWTEHTSADCTADFMGTSQSKYGSKPDGATTFWNYNDGSPLYDYTSCEPGNRDGCHGIRLFVQSRGYTVNANYSQYIYGYNGNTLGFTFAQFKSEIDAGRPVIIQVSGHTMLGYGYDDTGSIIYIRDTWDNSSHSMTWGGTYSGMQHYGVCVVKISCTTTFNAQGGSVSPASQTYILGGVYGSLPSPTRTGYTFGGWWTGTSGSGTQMTSASKVSAQYTTLYAKWTANTYSVAYDGNGSTGGATASSGHTYDVLKALTANGFIRTGYTFAGWATSAGGAVVYADGQSVLNLAAVQGATVTLYARWTQNATSTTPVPVPYVWLDQYPTVLNAAGGNYENAALADYDGDGMLTWQEFVAGTVPSDSQSVFRSVIGVDAGKPGVSWVPNLGAARVYSVFGRTNLYDAAWGPTNSRSRFFRVDVQMP